MNAARRRVSVLLLAAGAMFLAGPVGAADCLRPVGELPEGPSLAVDMEGSLAAFGRGRVLVLVDLTDPSDPVELGSVVLPGVVGSVELTATHAWVAAGAAGLIGVDVTDPTQPEIVSVPAGRARRGGVDRGRSRRGGRARLRHRDRSSGRWGHHTRLRIVDVSAPGAPADVGAWDSQEHGHAGAVPSPAVSCWSVDCLERACIVDGRVAAPRSRPRSDGTTMDGGPARRRGVRRNGVRRSARGGDRGLDISDPSHPALAARLSTGRGRRTLVVDGELLFVGGPRRVPAGATPIGAWIYDVSPPWLPTELGFVETPAPVVGLAAGDGLCSRRPAAPACEWSTSRTPREPVEIAALDAARLHHWWVRTERQPRAGRQAGSNQMTLVDISNAAHPVELGELPLLVRGPPDPRRRSRARSPSSGRTLRPESRSSTSRTRPRRSSSRSSTFRGIPGAWTLPDPGCTPSAGTTLVVIDVSDPTSPAVIGEADAGEGGSGGAGRRRRWARDCGRTSRAHGRTGAPRRSSASTSRSPAQPELLDTMHYPQAYAIAPRGGFPLRRRRQ